MCRNSLARWRFFVRLMLVIYPIWERDPTNLSVFHFPSEVMDTRKLLTELFSKNGSSNGGGFTMISSDGNRVFCYLCVKALKTGKMTAEGNIDEAFVFRGYCNWKDMSGGKGGLASHESSSVHKRAVEVIETLPRTTRDISEQLSSAHAEEKLRNRTYLLLAIFISYKQFIIKE